MPALTLHLYGVVCLTCLVMLGARPIARIFRREITWVSDVYVCMHKHVRLGGSGGMLPQEIIVDVLHEIASVRPFWDRSRAVVAT